MLQLIRSDYKPQPGDVGVVPSTDALFESAPVHFSTCGSMGGDTADQGTTGGAAATVMGPV